MTTEHTHRPQRLTREEFLARKPCPGCGRPLLDDEPWDFKGTLNFSQEERTRYDAEQTAYAELHGDCHAVRWSMEGSLTMHCEQCCPPHPLSAQQIDDIARILATVRRRSEPAEKPTPSRELRRHIVHVYDDDWAHAKEVAAERGEDISTVVRRALGEYVGQSRGRAAES